MDLMKIEKGKVFPNRVKAYEDGGFSFWDLDFEEGYLHLTLIDAKNADHHVNIAYFGDELDMVRIEDIFFKVGFGDLCRTYTRVYVHGKKVEQTNRTWLYN